MKKRTQKQKKDRFTVVRESIQSDFRVFGEQLDTIERKFERRFDVVDQQLEGLNKDLEIVKSELGLIRHDLRNKVSREEFKLLEARVNRLETLMRKR